ncbi:MAG: methylenetetrahydrofolate--tRNA-(uracil(54)-C(5))-methyltransferase (FADH(2)-oxidizing) TrmFO [Deltaproteobacteria bacterium]|nr:methylenetetrahydrofolate--tRNA-(uracil(54)-C(5))-methyltransferase (FADH(2)-oxidizing) TrmFO [Deltaproteobacteria bacterium]
MKEIIVIGGGLGGCEAAAMGARLGLKVKLYEMKPERFSPAHTMEGLAELVCSNSLKSESLENAQGVLKQEMSIMGSVLLSAAEGARVPAGKALAVDREEFSRLVTNKLVELGVEIIRSEMVELPPERPVIIATGPLSSDKLMQNFGGLLGEENMFFYDATSPIVYKDSIDFDVAYMAARYDKGGADYVNCPMNKEEYENFHREIIASEKTPLREFEKIPYFEGCMPVEEIASRGVDTLAFGPMRPVGLIDPKTGKRPHAVLQLRQENKEGTLFNLVGFQTRLTHTEQKRVFSLIPGLSHVRFARFGNIHRNTYINSPELLDDTLELKGEKGVFVAGQLTGVEGYIESAYTGLLAGLNAARMVLGKEFLSPPPGSMGAGLIKHLHEGGAGKKFMPMNANFGILETPLPGGKRLRGKEKKAFQAEFATRATKEWWQNTLES